MKIKYLFLIFIFILSSTAVFAQDAAADMNILSDVLGRKGLLALIGLMFFIYSYKNSIKLMNWFEDQTYGTRDYILQKCELIHIEIILKLIFK